VGAADQGGQRPPRITGVDRLAHLSPYDFTISVPADHPSFAGHFPGHPILPGVVLLAEVLAGVERGLGISMDDVLIRVAKFHAPVAPGACLAVRLEQGSAITFTVTCGDTRVASGTIAPVAASTTEGDRARQSDPARGGP